jgi:hypothetical protein
MSTERTFPLKVHLIKLTPIAFLVLFGVMRHELPDKEVYHILAILPLILLSLTWVFTYWPRALAKQWYLVPFLVISCIALIEYSLGPASIRDVPEQSIAGATLILMTAVFHLRAEHRLARRKRAIAESAGGITN